MVPLLVNGITYQYPELDDEGWGNVATNWAVAITQGTLQKTGGLFSLISDVDFGPSFGIKSIYFKSRSSNIALTGILRLSNTDTITFRNVGNTADLAFTTGSSDAIPSYAGIDLVNLSTAQTLSNKTITSSIFTGGTFNSPTINTPTVSGGTFTTPTINGGTLSNISISGGTGLFSDGSAASPSISFINANTTGLYKFASNSLGFSTNGISAGNITASGLWSLGNSTTTGTHQVFGNQLALEAPSGANAELTALGGSGGGALVNISGGSGGNSFISMTGRVSSVETQQAFIEAFYNDGTTNRQITQLSFLNTNTPASIAGGAVILSTSTSSGVVTPGFILDQNQTVTIGSVNSTTHQITGNLNVSGTITGTFSTPTITGQGLFANGSASAPSISFTNDHTTGLYFSTPHTLNFSTNGTNEGSIDQNGAWTFGAVGNGQTHIFNGYGLTLTTASPSPVSFEVSNTNGTGAYNATITMATVSGGGSPILYWDQFLNEYAMGVYYGDGLLRIEAGPYGFGSGSNVIAAKIDGNGTWILGPSGGTFTHTVNGNLNVTGTNTSGSFIPTSSTAPLNGMYLTAGGFLAFTSNGNLAASFDHSATPNLIVQGSISSLSGNVIAGGFYGTGSTLILHSNSLTALSFDGSPNATFTGNVGIQSGNSLKLFDSGNVNYIGIDAPTTVSSTYTITLPTAAPTAATNLTYNGTNYVWAPAPGAVSLISVILNDATTNGTAATFVSATTNVLFIQYSLKRGTNYQIGELKIVNDGTSPEIIDANVPIGDCGTIFSVVISGSNLLLQYTTTSTGTNVNMKYSPTSWAA